MVYKCVLFHASVERENERHMVGEVDGANDVWVSNVGGSVEEALDVLQPS